MSRCEECGIPLTDPDERIVGYCAECQRSRLGVEEHKFAAAKKEQRNMTTVRMVSSSRNGSVHQEWQLVRVTKQHAVLHSPHWTGRRTDGKLVTEKYRLDNGYRAGDDLGTALLGWRIVPSELPPLRLLASERKHRA